MQSRENLLPVTSESGSRQASHILKHYSRWFTFLYKTKSPGEKVTLVVGAKLLASYRKWRTRHTTSQ